MFKIYYPKSINATDFYIQIIKKAVENSGEEFAYIDSFFKVNNNDILITVFSKDFYRSRHIKAKKKINWFQGITPEERLRYDNRPLTLRWLLYLAHSYIEKYTLKHSDFNLFVSESMRNHYAKKYGYKDDNYIIMPCFNSKIEDSAFVNEKYKRPTYVYSGSADGWQCLPEIIALYKEIRERYTPNAKLIIYSPDRKKVQHLLDNTGVNAEIKFVKYTQLNEEIKYFKYGFLIRKDVDVNNVATPTKMNSYLANGIIPIFSDVIGDFKNIFKDLKFSIPLGIQYQGLEKLELIEKTNINADDVKEDFQTIFDRYYNEDYYINQIAEKIQALLK